MEHDNEFNGKSFDNATATDCSTLVSVFSAKFGALYFKQILQNSGLLTRHHLLEITQDVGLKTHLPSIL